MGPKGTGGSARAARAGRLRWARWAALLVALCLAAPAGAATRLCLGVRGDEAEALRRLVESELQHHRTHQLVRERCETRLSVEQFTVAGVRYLTARVNQEVPVRYSFRGGRELEERVREALRLVLANDPVYLSEDITRMSAVQRLGHSLLRRGHSRFRLELFGVVAATGAGAATAPGGALALQRGADHFQIFARIYGAGGLAATQGRRLRFMAGADAGMIYELSLRSSATFYVGAGVGVQLMRLEGRVDEADPGSAASALKADAVFTGRLGVRLFRLNRFDLDVFAQGHLPIFNAQDVDSLLPQAYTPSLQLGLGVGF